MNEPTPSQTANSLPRDAAPKKPYTPPQLIIHGTVVELTLGTQGNSPDGDASQTIGLH